MKTTCSVRSRWTWRKRLVDQLRPATDEDIAALVKISGIPEDVLRTALDREERSHVELEDDYIFVVVNTPVVLEQDEYDALPLGIFITRKYFITVCLEESAVIDKFLNGTAASFHTYKRRVSFSRSCPPLRLPSCTSCSRSTRRPTLSKTRCAGPCKIKSFSVCWGCKNL